MDHRRPDATRRRVIGSLGAIGAMAAIRSVIGTPGTPPATGSATRPLSVVPPAIPSSSVRAPSTPLEAQPPASPSAIVPAITVEMVCRDAWGARPANAGAETHEPVRITLHHTEVTLTSAARGPARARQHQVHHQSLGWPDIAYHFLIDGTGLVYEGRDVGSRGDTATTYDPTGHLLVCLEGDFDVQDPTPVQVSATVRLLAWASREYDIDPRSLAGHGDFADTTCPGAALARLIPSIAESAVSVGPVSIDRRCGAAGAEIVAAVEAGTRRSGFDR